MRFAAAAISSLFAASLAVAAERPSIADIRTLDYTGSEFAHRAGEAAKRTLAKRDALAATASFGAAPIPGWTVTQIGDVVFLQDDGTHQCDGGLSNEWFSSCMAGENAALDAFYAAYPEANPGYVSFYLAWDINAFFAFYQPIANDVKGIGQQTHGNVNGLNGLIFMNSIDLYSSYGESYREFLFDMIWGQEFGHRWGSFLTFTDEDGQPSDELLGRDDSHWSYFMDTDWSWMEGNDWTQSGNSFTTNFDTFGQPGYGYSQLDMYTMGLIPASGVDDVFFIRNPSGSGKREDPPAIMYGQPDTVTGKRVNVSIDQIIDAEGERVPSFDKAKRHFQVANLVILRSTDSLTQAIQDDMADYNEWATTHFTRDTFGLAYVETTIGTPLPNGAPTAVLELPTDAKEDGDAVELSASKSTDPDGDDLKYVWDFGDGTADYTTGPVVSHVFKKAGDLTVTVTAVDQRGLSGRTSMPIAVEKADDKGGGGGFGIGCSVDGAPASAIPTASIALLALAGMLAVGMRRRDSI